MANDIQTIQNLIYEIRGQRVMLDRDLDELYQVTTGNLNKAVKKNIRRFPPDFMFQLTKEEWDSLRFQFGIIETGRGKHTKYLPLLDDISDALTELQGQKTNASARPEIGYEAVKKQREKSA